MQLIIIIVIINITISICVSRASHVIQSATCSSERAAWFTVLANLLLTDLAKNPKHGALREIVWGCCTRMKLNPAQNQHICNYRHRKQCPTSSGKGVSCESKQWYTCSPSVAIDHRYSQLQNTCLFVVANWNVTWLLVWVVSRYVLHTPAWKAGIAGKCKKDSPQDAAV